MVKFEDIAGQTYAKRAIEIAAAGRHRILFFGGSGAGKEALVELARSLGVEARAELACWCGGDGLTRDCQCSPRAKERYARRLRKIAHDYEIVLEVVAVPMKEYGVRDRETTDTVLKRLDMVKPSGVASIDALVGQLGDAAYRTFEMAVRRLGLGCGQVASLLRVARTIADMHGEANIPARAVAESAQYHAPVWRAQ